jgi:hypothetical protein
MLRIAQVKCSVIEEARRPAAVAAAAVAGVLQQPHLWVDVPEG